MKLQKTNILKPTSLTVNYKGKTLEVLLEKTTIRIPAIGKQENTSKYFSINNKHNCGAQGYNSLLGDSCKGCEEEKYKENAMNFVINYLETEKIITKDYIPIAKQSK